MFKNPKILVTRFTHGAGGKFLSTVLQTANNVDHWNRIIESYKNHPLFTELVISYVDRSFPEDTKLHMQKEPMVPYNTDLYSSSYPRGNDVTWSQFAENAVNTNDYTFINALSQDKFINLIMNKPVLPKFCHGAQVVTILTEHKQELDWLHRTLWAKHFFETHDTIYYLPEHPLYCNFKSLPAILKYKNPCTFSITQKNQLINEKIINNHTCKYYKNQNNFSTSDSELNIKNIFIPLSSFFNFDSFYKNIIKIFSEFDLGHPNELLINRMHEIWLSRQLSYNDIL